MTEMSKFEFLCWLAVAIIFLSSVIWVISKNEPLERRIEHLEQVIKKGGD